ncbi:MAG: glycosyltransferase, partial [Pseudomonadota bacterium]
MAARLFRMRPVMRAWRQSFSGYSPFISLSRVFDRFAYHHLKVTRRDLRLEGCDGALLGQVEELQVAQGLVHIRGWAFAKTAEFHLSGVAVRDKVLSEGDADYLSFDIDLPYRAGPLEIRFETSRERAAQPVEVPLPEAAALTRARALLWGTFLTRLAWHGPGLAWALMRRDPSLTNRVKQALSLYDAELRERPIKPFELARQRDLSPVSGAVTLIVPVFNAFDLLPEMLQRVRENTDVTWRLIIIEDASTDARVRPFLRDWTAQHRAEGCDVTMLENPSNLGFVKSVNAGLSQAMAFDDPVILLNSDAFVPRGWASRLLRALLSDPKVASATPFSNKAEIFSVPAICQDVDLLPGQADEIDARLRARLAGFPIAAPTAVGFCMAMRRRFLDEVGLFDPAFGTGYGEEVDWCRKASRRGGRHVLAGNLFVEHRGAASFGQKVKQTRIQANNALISKRYPGYDLEVMNFIKSDPFLTQRLVAALAFLDTGLEADETVSVYVAHTLGGGAESYLAARIAQAKAAVILRLGGTERVSIEIITRFGITRGATNDLGLVVDLLSLLSRRRIVYSCAVGDRDPAHIPDFLLRLSQEAPLEVLFHDFFPLHPSYTLLDPDGVYRGTTLNPDVEAHPVEVKGRLYALD